MNRFALVPIAILSLVAGAVIRSPHAVAQDAIALAPAFVLSPATSGAVFDESAAPGGRTLGMWSQSTATAQMTTPSATGLTLRARGDSCLGAAKVSVAVDGKAVGTATLSGIWANYTIKTALAAGNHSVAITFTNDYRYGSLCDRNAYIGSVTAIAAAPTTTKPPVTTTTKPPVTTTTKPPVTSTTTPPVTTTTPPTTTPPVDTGKCGVNMYLASYYNNLTATGTPVTSRCEYSVGNTWDAQSPAPGVNAGNFSVLYTGSIDFPTSGTYNVNAQTGFVGVQAKIDGKPLIDYWPNQTWGRYHTTTNVTAGIHTVSVAVSNPTKNGHQHFSITPAGTSPASNNGNYFAANSFWNQPIPSNAIVHPNSETWRTMVANDSRNNAINVNSSQWSTGIYKAPAGTPTTTVRVTNSNKTITVPYLSSYKPTPDADAHLSIIDESNGCLYEFQAFNASNKTAIAQASYPAYTGSGAHASGPAHSGGELSYVAGMITPQDVRAGVIDHALRFAIPNNSSEFFYPATRSDGTVSGGVPEGVRIQLDPNLNLDTLGLTPFQKMVAKALQTYGGFNADGAANFAIYAQSPDDGSTYPMSLDALPKSLIGQLRYLAPTFTSTDVQMATMFDSGCQQQR